MTFLIAEETEIESVTSTDCKISVHSVCLSSPHLTAGLKKSISAKICTFLTQTYLNTANQVLC